MTSRHFFRTFRRLLLFSSSSVLLSFRNNRRLWTSLGTGALIGTTIYKTSSPSFEQLTRSFTIHAKTLEKDLSHIGMKFYLFLSKTTILISRKTTLSSSS